MLAWICYVLSRVYVCMYMYLVPCVSGVLDVDSQVHHLSPLSINISRNICCYRNTCARDTFNWQQKAKLILYLSSFKLTDVYLGRGRALASDPANCVPSPVQGAIISQTTHLLRLAVCHIAISFRNS